MKPLVFLGSGVSLPSFEGAKGKGYSSTESLTKALFEGSWFRMTTDQWQEDAAIGLRSPSQPRCQEFLLRLRNRTEGYYSNQRGSPISYEDLFSVIQQICDEAGWTDNAAIEPFRIAINDLCADLYEPAGHKPFERLARETLGFIQHVVAAKLGVEVGIEGLN
jgi:hypothetical protein